MNYQNQARKTMWLVTLDIWFPITCFHNPSFLFQDTTWSKTQLEDVKYEMTIRVTKLKENTFNLVVMAHEIRVIYRNGVFG